MNSQRGQRSLMVLIAAVLFLSGCATGTGREATAHDSLVYGAADGHGVTRRSAVVDVVFEVAYENDPARRYYPLEGIAGCEYSAEGTLIITDEKRGKVYGLDGGTRRWYEFASPGTLPYHPVDVVVDGFKVLVLDMGAGQVNRHDLSGAFLDVLVDLRRVDPVIQSTPAAFAVDRDGRLAICDNAQQQVLLLDTFQNLSQRIGDPGVMQDQFADPRGIAFLPDGGFIVADEGNRRLAHYGRLGFFEELVGGDTAVDNPFLTPRGIAVDKRGTVFVADSGRGLVHVLSANMRYQFGFGQGDQDLKGEGRLVAPVDVSVGPDDRLAVTDRGRNAVLVYRIIYE